MLEPERDPSMRAPAPAFSMPRWRITRWLADAGPDVPDDVRRALVASLFGTLPIFAGGVVNSILVAAVIAAREQSVAFYVWLAVEVAICAVRFAVLRSALRGSRGGRETQTDLYLVLGVAWAASVGYGSFISIASGDWLSATIACMSAAAMVGGICFRNFGAPRLSAVMTFASLGPTCLAAPISGEPAMLVTFVQIPFYLLSMRAAAYKLNALLVQTMRAEREHEHQARHDALTGLSNRVGLTRALEAAESRGVALLFIDLDGFKAVNDAHGHASGDRLLRIAADRLRETLRSGDVAARIGGDEFVVVANGLDRAQAEGLGERLIGDLGRRYFLTEDVAVEISVSVGVALTPDHGENVSELLDVADAALYRAKSAGKSRCVVAPAALRSVAAGLSGLKPAA